MSHHYGGRRPPSAELAAVIGALIAIGLILAGNAVGQFALATPTPQGVAAKSTDVRRPKPTLSPTPTQRPPTLTKTPTPTFTPAPTFTPLPSFTPAPTSTPSPSVMPLPSATPTPTRNLAGCNASGCGADAKPLPTVEYDLKLLLRHETPERRECSECPQNEHFSQTELDALVGANARALAQLRSIALSQEPYKVAPGVVYIVADYVHYVVVDLQESGFTLRNIIPPISSPKAQEEVRITPSYCFTPQSLVVMTADYHGLVGSNKTETGREIFFHLGRAALFQLDGEYNIDVIRDDSVYDRTSVSWGGGPIFIWDGKYNFNPEQEWFTPENLDHYENTRWAKMIVALSEDRRYLFLSASFDITLKEHAENMISLGEKWGIKVDRAMRFDGSESAYLAIRLGDYMMPVLGIEEPLIVNCLAVEREVATDPDEDID